ncbi:MAG: alpha/beta hydrolase, partial [Peptococcaceae bacterium]|nr:alpha/beta hydrolase [Peptococcaceae bacterium]
MMFGSYNKEIPGAKTEYDWLTRDEDEVARYMADPYCGYVCTNGFYHELLAGIQQANDPANIAKMNKKMPVYIFSGDKDPVGNYGKGVQQVEKLFINAGMEDVTTTLYTGGRHEMLNETNRDEVMADVVDWVIAHAEV